MTKSDSHNSKLRENEALFRKRNERVQSALKQDFNSREYEQSNIHFYCECPDPSCKVRIVLSPAEYEEIHTKRKRFAVAPGHQQPRIEEVVRKTDSYYIVEKFKRPPEDPSTLNPVNQT